MAIYELTKANVAEITKLRNWAKWLVNACQEDLDDANCPPDDGDGCGVETQAKFFLANAKAHFLEGVVEKPEFDEGHSEEFCPFCGLEDEDEISDPDEEAATEIITPWAAV
jgi:hypothetical protein